VQKLKIVILDGYRENPGDLSWDWLEKYGEYKAYDRTNQSEVSERISEADVVFTNKVVLNRISLEQSQNLKFIVVLAAGYDVVDIKAAKEFGIKVSNTPNYGSNEVAQMAFSHILEITNNIGKHNLSVKNNGWYQANDWCYWLKPIISLRDKNIGIIGYGNIGRQVGKIAAAFGMNVIVSEKIKVEDKNVENVSLDELFKRADIITLHCPLTDETRNIICKENIQKMKDGVIIINTARGPLVNEKDIQDGVKSKKIYAAGLDVLCSEPPQENDELIMCNEINITPHISWAAFEARKNIMTICEENLKAFLNGENKNIVNL
jgi:glycerate dehydrogenase